MHIGMYICTLVFSNLNALIGISERVGTKISQSKKKMSGKINFNKGVLKKAG